MLLLFSKSAANADPDLRPKARNYEITARCSTESAALAVTPAESRRMLLLISAAEPSLSGASTVPSPRMRYHSDRCDSIHFGAPLSAAVRKSPSGIGMPSSSNSSEDVSPSPLPPCRNPMPVRHAQRPPESKSMEKRHALAWLMSCSWPPKKGVGVRNFLGHMGISEIEKPNLSIADLHSQPPCHIRAWF